MAKLTEDTVLARIDEVLTRCGVSPGEHPADNAFDHQPNAAVSALTSASVATLHRLAEGTPYAQLADDVVEKYGSGNPYALGHLVGYLNALRADFEAGHLASVGEAL